VECSMVWLKNPWICEKHISPKIYMP